MKFFVVGETNPQLTGDRFFTQAKDEEEARQNFLTERPAMRKRPAWMVKVKEISEMEFREQRVE